MAGFLLIISHPSIDEIQAKWKILNKLFKDDDVIFFFIELQFSSIAIVTVQNFNEENGKKNKSEWGSYLETFTKYTPGNLYWSKESHRREIFYCCSLSRQWKDVVSGSEAGLKSKFVIHYSTFI